MSKPIFIHNLPRYVSMEGHYDKVPVYLDHRIIPGFPVRVAAVDLGKIFTGVAAAPHTHTTPEVYLLPEYPKPVTIHVIINGSQREMTSPSACLIPAGAKHQFRVTHAEKGTLLFGLFPLRERGGCKK